ncbi:MAG: hypothetical protein ACI8RC_003024, partial [Ilumatobacter sp.]
MSDELVTMRVIGKQPPNTRIHTFFTANAELGAIP